MEQFSRNILFWGEEFQETLKNKHVIVVGLGGVGGWALEALARSGVGKFSIVDFDCVEISNKNRQLIALDSTIKMKKTELFRQRLKEINKEIEIKVFDDFYCEKMNEELFNKGADYVIDAIDTLRYKVALIEYCVKNNLKIITSMGAGNRIDPSQLYISKIEDFKPSCVFSKNVMSKLKKHEVFNGVEIVASREKPFSREKIENNEKITTKSGQIIEITKFTPASTPFVAPAAGLYISSHIVTTWLNGLK